MPGGLARPYYHEATTGLMVFFFFFFCATDLPDTTRYRFTRATEMFIKQMFHSQTTDVRLSLSLDVHQIAGT